MKTKMPERVEPVSLAIYPTLDRLLVERDEPLREIGGIAIPDTALERMRTGTVMAVGPDVKRLSAGAKVLFGEHAGIPTPLSGKDLLVMDEGEILAIIVEKV